MTKYKMVGYCIVKGQEQWQEFNDNAILPVPDGINKYDALTHYLNNVMEHWLVYLEEIKEGE